MRRRDRVRVDLALQATSVRTGGARVLRNADLSIEAPLASASLPQLFQAVEIDGKPYSAPATPR